MTETDEDGTSGAGASADAAVPTDPLGAFVIGPCLLESGAHGGPLSGMHFAVKDVFDVVGTRTGAGNPDWLADAPVAAAHAPAVVALLAAGANLVGKTVSDELAYSLSGTNVHYGTPVNAAAPGHVPGGSSSGSAAAVAGGAVELALGTDTGGSVRVPASYCGVYGLRSTHGRVSVRGLVPLAPSFDTVGLFATEPSGLASAWRALAAGAAGADPGDPADAGDPDSPPAAAAAAARTVRRLIVATDLMGLADDGVAAPLRAAVAVLGDRLGLPVVETVLGRTGELDAWRDAFRVLQQVEAWRSHGRWITARHPNLGPGITDRFAKARATDPTNAAAAQLVRAEASQALHRLIGGDGLLLQPAASGPAPLLVVTDQAAKDDVRLRTLTLTAPVGLAGVPALSLPLAEIDGLPVGLALVGLPGDDEVLVDLAKRADSR